MFVLLLASFVLSAFLPGRQIQIIPLFLYLAALLLAMRTVTSKSSASRGGRRILLAGSVVAVAAAVISNDRAVHGAVASWLAVILLYTIVVLLRRVLVGHRVVTVQTIFGVLSAYLLIGLLFAALFSAVSLFQGQPLFAMGKAATNSAIQYFSFSTLTTVGFGDYTAAGEPARTLAVLEALFGQIFLVTVVARLVSIFGTTRRPTD
ncbi:ion channel [Micromonospora sp. NPDC003197]